MRIAVVARMLRRDKLEGIGMFAHETLSRIVQSHPEHEFIFLFDRRYEEEFVYAPNVKPVVLSFAARHPAQMAYWHQVALRKYLSREKPDVLVSPDGSIPLNCPVPSLAVIHDLNFEHYPQDLPFSFRRYYRYYYPRIAKAATRIVTVSEFCREDISKTYGVNKEKTDVVYNGAGGQYDPLSEMEIQQVRQQVCGGAPYFLFVGSIHKRKNVPAMLRAYHQFRSRTGAQVKFVIAGAKRWNSPEMEEALSGSSYRDDIYFTGRVSSTELPKLTGAAYALVLVSRFEGFGIPVVEAMRCGVPVITSDVTALPEVAGGAALLANPFSDDSISEAMFRLYKEDTLRQSLITKGIERAKQFTWEASAAALWKSIEKTVRG